MGTVWRVSKYGVLSGPYFPVFGPEKAPYLGTFHAVEGLSFCVDSCQFFVWI